MAPTSKWFLDWVRSDEAKYSADEIADVEAMRKVTESVADQIRFAFKDVRLGDGIGLYEGEAFDGHNDREYIEKCRAKDERDSWQNLSEEVVWENEAALYFTDARGLHFLLPAFMVAALDGLTVYEAVIPYLCMVKARERIRAVDFTTEQLESIIAFLRHYVEDSGYEYDHPQIKTAIESFWTPLLSTSGVECIPKGRVPKSK